MPQNSEAGSFSRFEEIKFNAVEEEPTACFHELFSCAKKHEQKTRLIGQTEAVLTTPSGKMPAMKDKTGAVPACRGSVDFCILSVKGDT